MEIGLINAAAYTVPVTVPLREKKFNLPFCLVRIETDEGLVGHGICGGLTLAPSTAKFINEVIAPELKGEDPLRHERIWQLLLSKYNVRTSTGFWSAVASAIDIAIWDLRGKALGLPIATLLGGANKRVPAYVTFGLAEYDREQLAEAGRMLRREGHRRLKIVVGGLTHPTEKGKTKRFEQKRFFPEDLREDAARVRAVREAVGADTELMIDANCAFTPAQALQLAAMVEDCDLTWFEEPVVGNDFRGLLEVKNGTRIPIAAGQHLGHVWAHRELIVNGAVDISQPNVCHGGGYTEAVKVAALARAFNLPIANGGAWPHHNLHLHAGMQNGSYVEYHYLAWKAGDVAFRGPPATKDGWVDVPDTPGLGFDPIPPEELKEFAI